MTSIVISFISGILLSLAFPRANLYWLAWIAVTPLMYYVYRLPWKYAAFSGLAFGVGFFGSLLYWIGVFGRFPWVALAVFQALFILGFVLSAKLIGSRLGPWGRFALLPSLWVAFEWIRTQGLFGFTWGDLGYSQYHVLPVIQIASLGGIWGVSFLIALVNAALASAAASRKSPRLRRDACAHLAIAGVAVLSSLVYGWIILGPRSDPSGTPVKAAVVQGAISQDRDMDLAYREETWRVYRKLTSLAGERKPDLIVWPETVVPGCLGRDPYPQRVLTRMAEDAGARMLVGGWDEDDEGRGFNTAFLISPGEGITGRYSKVHLVPFGEFVPARRYLPFLQYYQVSPMDVCPGAGYSLLDAGSYKVGTAICFESIFPSISRRLTASGANLLCVITNDCWFQRTAAAEQHMAKSVLRAVENRRYVLRAATTGISCIVDPRGRILGRAGLFEEAVLVKLVRTQSGLTLYTRHGDWIVYVCLASVVGLAVVSLARRRRKEPI